ncbi:MAG TPA: hypothetical protein VGX68_00005, partial [Thermoanaerobaculia bacterium]|nr:hypothetical protein [Thermoanaerobaculia bacterium]
MSTFSDVQELYGSVRSTWTKSQAHVVVHIGLLVLLFGFLHATLPALQIPQVDPKRLADNEWFTLAKDTGLIYVSFVVPVLIVAIYLALLRTVGQILATITLLFFPPPENRSRSRLLSVTALEPLAASLTTKDFTIGDLFQRASDVTLHATTKRDELWQSYQESIGKIARNSQTYLGDCLLFLLAWMSLFRLAHSSSWVIANKHTYWPVVLSLTFASWLSWFRVSRALAALPALQVLFASSMARLEPEVERVLDNADRRDRIRERLYEILESERRQESSRPSVRKFVEFRLGIRGELEGDTPHSDRPLFFPTIYSRGQSFRDHNDRQDPFKNPQWVQDYLAYLYFLI